MIYSCCGENRKSAIRQNPALNGIDYLEVLDSAAPAGVPRQQTLLVHCLNPLAAGTAFSPSNVVIEGGESVTNIAVDWVIPAAAIDNSRPPPIAALLPVVDALSDKANVLVVRTHEAGDFTTYCLRLVQSVAQAKTDPFAATEVLAGFDTQLAEVAFSFKVECGPDFDCDPQPPGCPPATFAPPPINYLAKDYGSFRTVMLDRLRQLLPGWGGASEADLGVTLADLIAYVGDYLSYQQDAVATEAYLETARRRVSLRRHALLVDYQVRDGCNARVWMRLTVSGDTGEAVFLDRTQTRFYTFAPGMPSSLAVGSDNEEAALNAGVQVFEPMHDAVLYPEHNGLSFYTWGESDCCVPAGATEATLQGSYPRLKPGDVLIFQEVTGPQTGNPADADLRHRCAVRLTAVATQDSQGQPLVDPLFPDAAGNPIPVTEIQWAAGDALPFPLCLSSTYVDSSGASQTLTDVSVAFGNVVLADHGLFMPARPLQEVPLPSLYYAPDPAADRCQGASRAAVPVRYRPLVPDRPLTQAVPLPAADTPVTAGVVPLGGTGPVSLTDPSGFACLTLRATNPASWPQYFGVIVQANTGNPANIDLSVVYNPAAGAAGLLTLVAVERFTNLSFNPADASYIAAQINANSTFLKVPATYTPPAGPLAGFPAAPTMLRNTGSVALQDLGTPPVTYLTLQPASATTWPQSFGVRAQTNAQTALQFDLAVVYNPASGGVGVGLPVTVERFSALTLDNVTNAVNARSNLILVSGVAQALHPGPSAHDLVTVDARTAVPVISLAGTLDGTTTTWSPRQDLLESGDADAVFVVEVEADATASLRFGDDTNGRRPEPGTSFSATYRIGNGAAGNVGAESLVYLATPDAHIASCINPLPATGGTDPETAEQIRRRAPQAFFRQERAVTMADYDAMTELDPRVDRAAASLRWTGSWYTVFVAVEPHGGGMLTPVLGTSLKGELERYRLAGQDLELDSAQYVSLEVVLAVCVDPAYFRDAVQQALLMVLSNRILADGTRGLFYPDNFSFGQTVYLSPLYAAARAVAGVVSVVATTFQPQGVTTNRYLEAGEIPLGPLQVARLDSDPSYPSHGQLTLVMEGGK